MERWVAYAKRRFRYLFLSCFLPLGFFLVGLLTVIYPYILRAYIIHPLIWRKRIFLVASLCQHHQGAKLPQCAQYQNLNRTLRRLEGQAALVVIPKLLRHCQLFSTRVSRCFLWHLQTVRDSCCSTEYGLPDGHSAYLPKEKTRQVRIFSHYRRRRKSRLEIRNCEEN
jgi:hypothetical protein